MAKVPAKDRSEQLLPFYLGLGTSRTLVMAQRVLHEMGIPIDVRTLKRYSATYGWVERAREFDRARLSAEGTMPVVSDAIASDARHAALGRAMQTAAARGLTQIQSDKEYRFTGAEVARLGAEGVKIERLASGEATEIVAVMEDVYSGVVEHVGPAFTAAWDLAATYLFSLGVPNEAIAEAKQRALASFVADTDRMIQMHWVRTGIIQSTTVESSRDGDSE